MDIKQQTYISLASIVCVCYCPAPSVGWEPSILKYFKIEETSLTQHQ